ncbi:MAG: PspC domain-containing protein, partial [Bacteroidales bacterium]
MKRAIKINLSGQVFHIDEDAYEKLKNYLDSISSHFSDVQESREILDDIENRIAELLSEKLTDPNRVVSLKDVEEIIEIMGRPEEIADEEGAGEEKRSYTGQGRRNRRLYRDPDNAVIGGVASGLSAYFNVDLLLIRILFVVLILAGAGFPFILYLVLWIAVPKAKTAAEKLEMQGEKVNVSNLEKKIREEYEDVKENFKKARNSETGRKTESFFQEFFRVLGVIIVAFAKIILAFIAVGFVIAGISLIASLVGVAFFGAGMGTLGVFHLWDADINNFITPFIDPVNLTVIAVAGILLVLIPVLAIIYGLFKALFRFKARDRGLGMSAFALWILALITVVTLGIIEGKEYMEEEDVTSSFELNEIGSDTLYLSINNTQEDLVEDKEEFGIDNRWYFIGTDEEVYGKVEIDFRSTDDEF